MLQLSNLTIRVAGRTLLDRGNLRIDGGHHVGLVGRNGTGKSTLLKVIAGEISADEGSIELPTRWRVGMTRQEAPASDTPLIDLVLAADQERLNLLAQADNIENADSLADIHARLQDIDAASAPARAARILFGLGFNEEAQHRPAHEFSGGWRMRVALASLLFSQPDLLLLDEPTNHLDLEAALWLEDYLRGYHGTILIVSHDRSMLNRVVQEVVHLEHQKLTFYKGNYDFFEKTRVERLELEAKQREKQAAQRAHIQAFVDRFRYKKSKATQAQSRLKMLERMQPIAAAVQDPSINLDFPQPNSLASPLITWDQLEIGYNKDPAIFKRLDLRIDADDRIALLGANGNGKTTLVKVLAQRLRPRDGLIQKSSKMKVGYFAQHQADEFDLESTAFQILSDLMPRAVESQVRAQLGKFGFGEEKADTQIKNLSGGEKARLLLSLITRDKPHLILLDEPTNHLDVDSRQALVHAINSYDGAVVLVSHDTHLLEACADRLWLVENGQVQTFDGDLGDYRRHLAGQKRHANPEAICHPAKETADTSTADKKIARRTAAEKRAALAPLRKAVDGAEADLTALNNRKALLEQTLADPRLYEPANSEKAAQATKKMGEVMKALLLAEEAWIRAQEKLDAIENAN